MCFGIDVEQHIDVGTFMLGAARKGAEDGKVADPELFEIGSEGPQGVDESSKTALGGRGWTRLQLMIEGNQLRKVGRRHESGQPFAVVIYDHALPAVGDLVIQLREGLPRRACVHVFHQIILV